jgi:hypothetical protein
MSPELRKLSLTAHLIASIGWVGALAVFLAHALVSYSATDVQLVRGAALAMDVSAWFVILPLAIGALATGLIHALATPWGLFRHYWIVFKLVLTGVATLVLLLKLGPISDLRAQLDVVSPGEMSGLRTSLLFHAVGGLLVLLAVATLGVYKPAGRTPYRRAPGADAAMPRWVKVFGIAILLLLVAVGIMVAGGGHGPGAHVRLH